MKDFFKKNLPKINFGSKRMRVIFVIALLLIVLFFVGRYVYNRMHVSDYSHLTILINSHEYVLAEQELQGFLANNSNDPYFLILAARTYIGLGEMSKDAEARQEMFLKAIKFVNSAESINNEIPELYKTKGIAYFNLGEIKSAEIFYKKALDLDPGSVDLQISLGDLALLNHNVNKSYEYYNRVISIDPTNIKARIGITKLMQLQKRYDLALNYAREVYTDSTLESSDKAQLAELIGQLYFKNKNYFDSERFYNFALETNPTSVYALYGLAETEFARSFSLSSVATSTLRAKELAEKAVIVDPLYPYTYILLSRIASLSKDKDKYDKYSVLAKKSIEAYPFIDTDDKKNLLKLIPTYIPSQNINIKIKVISAKINSK